jgi:hypothetical protein
MKRIGILSIFAAVLLTAGCIMFPPQEPQPQHAAPSPESVIEATPPQADLTQPPQASAPEATPPQASSPAAQVSACHAERYQGLVGQPIASVDQSTLPAQHRVICMGCMATMEFVADRLTIQLGPNSTIASLRCG